MHTDTKQKKIHKTVMKDEVLAAVEQVQPQCFFDGTMGHGGHTLAVAQWFPSVEVCGCDVDSDVLQLASQRFADNDVDISVVHGSYADIASYQWRLRDMILLDLGINRHHIWDDNRGFSFQTEGPLDMRFGQSWPTCYEMLQGVQREDLLQAFGLYGDFSPARAEQLVTLILKNKKTLTTTTSLTDLLAQIGMRKQRIAVVYQVLRILTNREWDNIRTFLSILPDILSPDWLCLVMTYHSGEDRIVKQWFRDLVAEGWWDLYTKKVVKPHWKEVQTNKAARSALLRWIYKR